MHRAERAGRDEEASALPASASVDSPTDGGIALTAATRDFARRVIDWQGEYGRHDLPWQQAVGAARDPYRVWLSEIMLQQTQVATVIPYYHRFLARFPTLAALAAAPLGDVLENWAGLGYYARARNLHRCAQTLVADYDGAFPRAAARIAELPGIGRSTAAAIAAFGFGERAAILDGNVKRVFARCFGIEGFTGTPVVEKRLWALAEALLPASGVEVYTQGLMDLGATICTRGAPRCGDCPLGADCVARRDYRQDQLPTPRPKKTVPERQTTLLILDDGNSVLLERRPPSGIWGGLLAPPECAGEASADEIASAAESLARRHGCRLLAVEALPPLTHSFTHFRLHIAPQRCRVERNATHAAEAGWEWVSWNDAGAGDSASARGCSTVATAALPAPVRLLLKAAAP
ncbi:A/G-specific adenine glycosylase [Rhodocyclus tenuis]|uniref:Adenine DNA glycosylase n=1 Tax=Rhodocyclus tenuis TaxID=1066 RepID=A0A840G703_RHOTE|nr:A/G-specific adenine glycosylase [Rhodocyclus tenuis]MBB4246478.1 A/G-specific adenine glycosylase [Rhodocyclus tenuis]